MEEKKISEKAKEGFSIREMCKFFDVSYTTMRYWLNKFKIKTSGYTKTYNWEEKILREAIEKSECKSDILRHLNISVKSGNFQTLERYCIKYSIDINHLKYSHNRGHKFQESKTNEELFVENSTSIGKTIKERIIKEKLIKYKCACCKNEGEWMGIKLTLQLDHINGVNNDNRLNNLRFLCPNCHSQTKTYAAKNKNNSLTKK